MNESALTSTRKLYAFLCACGGNWRNTIHVTAQEGHNGWLLAADSDGKPLVVNVDAFQNQIQEQIDTSECRGTLTAVAFEDIFARYLLWQFPDANGHFTEALNLLSNQI